MQNPQPHPLAPRQPTAPPRAPATLPAGDDAPADERPRLWQRVLAVFRRLHDVLQRAEQCVTERFRVPPHAG